MGTFFLWHHHVGMMLRFGMCTHNTRRKSTSGQTEGFFFFIPRGTHDTYSRQLPDPAHYLLCDLPVPRPSTDSFHAPPPPSRLCEVSNQRQNIPGIRQRDDLNIKKCRETRHTPHGRKHNSSETEHTIFETPHKISETERAVSETSHTISSAS